MADEKGLWDRREVFEGMIILHYPKTVLMCSIFGCCAVTAASEPMEEPIKLAA